MREGREGRERVVVATAVFDNISNKAGLKVPGAAI